MIFSKEQKNTSHRKSKINENSPVSFVCFLTVRRSLHFNGLDVAGRTGISELEQSFDTDVDVESTTQLLLTLLLQGMQFSVSHGVLRLDK